MDSTQAMKLLRALAHHDSSVRLRAAMAIGADPDPRFVVPLVERCAVDDDFFVRDMLTWALIRHPAAETIPRLVSQTRSANPQARSQALHTLSKTGDTTLWPVISDELLADDDDEVARVAWRTAADLVPDDERARLAGQLARQLGRGGIDVRKSLSRALATIGEPARTAVESAADTDDEQVRAHALVTLKLIDDPSLGYDYAIEEVNQVLAMDYLDQARGGD